MSCSSRASKFIVLVCECDYSVAVDLMGLMCLVLGICLSRSSSAFSVVEWYPVQDR